MIEGRVISQNITQSFDFYGEIDNLGDYKNLIDELHNAADGDVIILNINSPGGRCDIGFMIVKSILQTKATVVAHVVYPSASMASVIACTCDALVMDPHSYLMFHTYSGGAYGKGDELMQDVFETKRSLEGQFTACIGKFLTKKEIEKMLEGKDIYIRADDANLADRCKRHFKCQSMLV